MSVQCTHIYAVHFLYILICAWKVAYAHFYVHFVDTQRLYVTPHLGYAGYQTYKHTQLIGIFIYLLLTVKYFTYLESMYSRTVLVIK